MSADSSGRATARPVIGLTTYVEPVSRGDWVDQPSVVLAANYAEHVRAAGGIVVLVPPELDPDDATIDTVLDRLDGLILTGGVDIEASRYGAEPHATAQERRPDRDSMEIALARRSQARDLPVLGICRGMQVMAVAAGGAIEQHLPDRTGGDEHSPLVGVFGSHPVRIDPESRLGGILGDAADVPTYHHQAVSSHPGFTASAWHPDGTVEAMEDPAARFRLAVQWHPEAGSDNRLFAALVAAARPA